MSVIRFDECLHEHKQFDFNLAKEHYFYCSDRFHELLIINDEIKKVWKSELGPLRKIATARKGVFHYLMKLEERKIIEKFY